MFNFSIFLILSDFSILSIFFTIFFFHFFVYFVFSVQFYQFCLERLIDFNFHFIFQGIELYRISAKIANLHSKVSLKEQKSPVKDVDTVRQEIENLFEKLTSNTREDGTDSLKNLSLAIEKRRRSESLMVNGSNASPNVSVLEQIDKVEQILDTQQQNIHQNNG